MFWYFSTIKFRFCSPVHWLLVIGYYQSLLTSNQFTSHQSQSQYIYTVVNINFNNQNYLI